jgi:hypothetical protein
MPNNKEYVDIITEIQPGYTSRHMQKKALMQSKGLEIGEWQEEFYIENGKLINRIKGRYPGGQNKFLEDWESLNNMLGASHIKIDISNTSLGQNVLEQNGFEVLDINERFFTCRYLGSQEEAINKILDLI